MKPTEKYIQRKQALVTEITKLITRDGFENLTVRGICQELQISIGSFYHYFPEKDDLIKVLFTDIDDYFSHIVTKDFTTDEAANLVHFFEGYGKYTIKNGVETCRCISIAPLKTKNHHYLEDQRSISQVLLGILQRGSKNGQFELSLSPEETTRMLLILIRGYSADWAKHNGEYNLTIALHTFSQIFLKSITHSTADHSA